MKKFLLFLFLCNSIIGQNISLNNDFIYSDIAYKTLNGELKSDYSFNIKPIELSKLNYKNSGYNDDHTTTVFSKNKFSIKVLPAEYWIEYNSSHPYNRNNGSMIPNRGYQHIFSSGIYVELGPLSIQLNPEHHYSENKNFNGFWEGHYDYHWAKRYRLWNRIDMPERFGNIRHNRLLIGQSSIRLNLKKISIGISNENLWWGPSYRNSIMMSNHAEGFKHITINTRQPLKTFIGNFEFQLITGRLESSGYTPPGTNRTFGGTKLYIPKINQRAETFDWRYLQGYIISYNPKWINNFHVGFIRWTQMYQALINGGYPWLEGSPTFLPVFSNLFRNKDKYVDFEAQTNQAAGLFLKWQWLDSKAEFYAEFHHNDSKQNVRDLILDSDHSRAATIGLRKIFEINNNNYLFSWEWTQMEQTASRLLRDAGSWYEHGWVYDGYTNKGEVLGSSIGPGSNSHFFSFEKIGNNKKIGIGFEIIDQDNDFYHEAFNSADDYRRFWKDLNFHVNISKKLNNMWMSLNAVYIRSLNYQWQLEDNIEPYYHPGKDVNNFHLTFKILYHLPF